VLPAPPPASAPIPVAGAPGIVNVILKPKKKEKVQYPQDSRLHDAARAGRVQEVSKLLQDGVNVNSLDFLSGSSALHAAVEHKLRSVFDVLLKQADVDLSVHNRRGQTPLHLSIARRNDEMTNELLALGADPYMPDNTGKTPFDLAGQWPAYQGGLKEELHRLTSAAPKEPVAEAPQDVAEAVSIYLKSGYYKTVALTRAHTARESLLLLAEKIQMLDMKDDLELQEDIMGKVRAMKPDERMLEARDKWPNNNPLYCKFQVKVKRGSAENVQMKFRDIVYGK